MNPLCRRDLRRARRSSLPPPSLTPNGVDRVGLAGHRGRLIRSREGGANGPTIERTGRASVCRGDGRSRRQRARSVAPPRLVGRVAAVRRTGTGACQRPRDHRELARWSADGSSEPRCGRRRPLGHDALVHGPAGRWLGGLLVGRRTVAYPDGSTWFFAALLELRDSKMLRETWYYAPPSEAPAWRAQWVERIG